MSILARSSVSTNSGFHGREHWSAGFVSFAVGIPLFFSIGPGGIGPPTGPTVAARGANVGVPVSLLIFLGIVCISVGHLRARRSSPLASYALFVFVAVNATALLFGSLFGDIGANSIAFFLQTLLPLAGYVYGSQLLRRPNQSVADTYMRIFVVPLACLLVIGLTTLVAGGRPWVELGTRLGPFEVPQILRYVPTVFASAFVGLGFNWFQGGRSGKLRGLLLLSTLVLLTAVHSRTSLLIVVAGVGLATIVRTSGATRNRKLSLIAWIALLGVVLFAALPQLSDGPVALNRLVGDDEAAQLSSERRYDALVGSFSESLNSPFGRAYAANENVSLGGVESTLSRVSNSENQLGEFGLRAGPIAVLAVVLFLVATMRQSYTAIRRSEDDEDAVFMMSIWVSVAAALMVSTFTQQPLSQPFPGLYLWMMLGLLRGWTIEASSAERNSGTESGFWPGGSPPRGNVA